MAAFTYPGVYIEELSSGQHTITGVATSIGAFIGWAAMGPTDQATLVQSWSDFQTIFGGLDSRSWLGYSVNQFFANGGSQCYIVRLVWDTTMTGGVNNPVAAATALAGGVGYGTATITATLGAISGTLDLGVGNGRTRTGWVDRGSGDRRRLRTRHAAVLSSGQETAASTLANLLLD